MHILFMYTYIIKDKTKTKYIKKLIESISHYFSSFIFFQIANYSDPKHERTINQNALFAKSPVLVIHI